jgi:hypothetical protein
MGRGRLMYTTAHKLISALGCNAENNFIAAGIENPEDGPASSPVYIWYINPYLKFWMFAN